MKKKKSSVDNLKNMWWILATVGVIVTGLIAFGEEITRIRKTPEEIEQFKGEYYENQKEQTEKFTEFAQQTSNFMSAQQESNEQNKNLLGLLTANLLKKR